MNSNQRNMIILFITMVVVMLGFGIIIPILPFYVESMGASGTGLGLLMAIFGLMQLIFSPVWGSLSDRVGRKPILLLGIIGNIVAQLLMGFSTQMWMLFVARALSGILSSATLPTAMAFIGDSTDKENRGKGMGIIGAAMGVGMILGPGIGGWLAKDNLSLPFFVAAGLSTVVLFFVYLILPESLPPESRSQTGKKLQGPDFKQMWAALFGPLGYLMVMSFLLSFGLTNFESIFGLFALERYNYEPNQVGTVLVFIGIISVIIQGGLIGPLTKRWGESRLIQGSLLISGIGFPLMLTANSFVSILLTTGIFMLGNSLLRPSTASLISRRGGDQEQGMAMGMHNSFMSLGRIIGPIWAGTVFDINVSLPYISGSIIMIAALLTTLIWLNKQQSETAPIYAPE